MRATSIFLTLRDRTPLARALKIMSFLLTPVSSPAKTAMR